MDCFETRRCVEMERQSEQGFMLVGLIVAIFLILLALSVAAPKVAQDLRREREVEAIHRGNQYVRAIRLYYRKSNTYPATIEQLEKTTNIRYLRQRYVDPITGKDDWRLIHVGEAKTTVKGFFGQPLAGLATGPGAGMGSPIGSNAGAAGAAGPGQTGLTSVFGSPGGGGGLGSSSPGGGLGSSSGGLGSSPGGGGLGGSTVGGTSTLGGTSSGGLGSSTAGTGTAASTIGASGGIGGQSATSFSGSAQPFVGVGVPKEGDSITILNEQTTYNTWEFIYDPRIEQLYAKGAMLGAGSNALGSGSGSSMGSGSGSSLGGFGNNPGSGTGTGLGSGSGLGTMPGSTSPTTPTTPQQPH
jgi:type II secretory pathway pseudopilin PulG